MFYQNVRSIYSSLVTLILNRIGDCFFLIAIVLFIYSRCSYDCVGRSYFSDASYVLIILTLSFITKRAIFPFSPWLPLAMAAPTPISALVHSSTLVTSGLYLMMRFSYFIYRRAHLCELIVVVSIFTSFYAGINRVFEVDLKKIVALSTLRHLGFISSSLFLGLLEIRFFHLISHALFKSLLFMSLGDVLIALNHSQDTRYLSVGLIYTPFSSYMLCISVMSLLGVVSTVGFFSKDLILEFYCFTFLSNFVFMLLFLNVCLTFYYSLKLFYYTFSYNKLMPYQLFRSPGWLHSRFLFVSGLSTTVFGFFFCSICYPFLLYVTVPLTVKLYPVFFTLLGFSLLLISVGPLALISQSLTFYGGSMCFLSTVCVSFVSNSYQQLVHFTVKSSEVGLFIGLLNNRLAQVVKRMAARVFIHFSKPSLLVLLFTVLSFT